MAFIFGLTYKKLDRVLALLDEEAPIDIDKDEMEVGKDAGQDQDK
jgi:hypothetical protein